MDDPYDHGWEAGYEAGKKEAASEIGRLRAALRDIANWDVGPYANHCEAMHEVINFARNTLAQKERRRINKMMTDKQDEIIAELRTIRSLIVRIANNTAKDGTFVTEFANGEIGVAQSAITQWPPPQS